MSKANLLKDKVQEEELKLCSKLKTKQKRRKEDHILS